MSYVNNNNKRLNEFDGMDALFFKNAYYICFLFLFMDWVTFAEEPCSIMILFCHVTRVSCRHILYPCYLGCISCSRTFLCAIMTYVLEDVIEHL